jgi:hypothetical protein
MQPWRRYGSLRNLDFSSGGVHRHRRCVRLHVHIISFTVSEAIVAEKRRSKIFKVQDRISFYIITRFSIRRFGCCIFGSETGVYHESVRGNTVGGAIASLCESMQFPAHHPLLRSKCCFHPHASSAHHDGCGLIDKRAPADHS